MKIIILNWFIKNKIPFSMTVKEGFETLIIDSNNREKALNYCFKHKLIQAYNYIENETKVELIFKKEVRL
jgi:hypothetical protein